MMEDPHLQQQARLNQALHFHKTITETITLSKGGYSTT